MSKIGTIIGIGIFCFQFHFSVAQQSEVDSLRSLLQQEKIKVHYESALAYENSQPDSALARYKAGLKLAEEIKNDTLIAKGCYGIGRNCTNTGKSSEAIDYLFRALKIFEHRHINSSMIGCLQYIAIAYNEQGIYDKAMNYSMQALQSAQSTKDTARTSLSLSMIGSIYYAQNNNNMALLYFQQALQKMEAVKDTQGIADALNNVALIYEKKKDFDKALEYHLRGLKMAKDLKDKRGIAASYHNIAEVYKSLNKFPVAIQYYDSCIASAKQMDGKFYIKESYNSLSEVYEKMRKYDMAYKTHLLFSKYKDTLLNEESKRQFAEMSTNMKAKKRTTKSIC
jgi:tetratricopeptide (TPR) repeat protein